MEFLEFYSAEESRKQQAAREAWSRSAEIGRAFDYVWASVAASSGVHAVNEILQTFSVPVIFITAYPERPLTGAKPEPTFLIRKPYRLDEVKAVISQALFLDVRP